MKQEIIKQLNKIRILNQGNFILKSGKTSNFYLDLKKVYKFPELTNLICEEILNTIKKLNIHPNAIAASGHGGIPLATILSNKINLPLTLVRDIFKDHGKISKIDGYVPNKNDGILIIDDVFSSGTSIKQTISNLEPTEAKILGAFVVIHREEGTLDIPLYSLIKLNELLR